MDQLINMELFFAILAVGFALVFLKVKSMTVNWSVLVGAPLYFIFNPLKDITLPWDVKYIIDFWFIGLFLLALYKRSDILRMFGSLLASSFLVINPFRDSSYPEQFKSLAAVGFIVSVIGLIVNLRKSSKAEQIEKLFHLKKAGALTAEEFEGEKQKILRKSA